MELLVVLAAFASGAISTACVMDVHYSRKRKIR